MRQVTACCCAVHTLCAGLACQSKPDSSRAGFPEHKLVFITATLFYIAERLRPSAGVTAAKRTPPSMSTHASDHTEKPQPDPVEDPTGRGTLGQFAKRGAEGVQVLADKMTGQESSR